MNAAAKLDVERLKQEFEIEKSSKKHIDKVAIIELFKKRFSENVILKIILFQFPSEFKIK